jgi:hypothetical protein
MHSRPSIAASLEGRPDCRWSSLDPFHEFLPLIGFRAIGLTRAKLIGSSHLPPVH